MTNAANLASRDIVSRAIDSEMKKSGDECVFLDCTHLDIDDFKKHFPTIYETCLKRNINVANDWIPVVPASHYLCGGVVVDMDGKTSVKNLFACGRMFVHRFARRQSDGIQFVVGSFGLCGPHFSVSL